MYQTHVRVLKFEVLRVTIWKNENLKLNTPNQCNHSKSIYVKQSSNIISNQLLQEVDREIK